MTEFYDMSIMPFGEAHKGKHLKDVPGDYLTWLYENDRAGRLTDYIEDNWDELKKEAKQKR